MLLGPDHAGTGQRHGTGQCKDSTGHTGAGGYGVADVRENVSCKGGVGAESGGAADLPEDISCRAPLARATEELLAVVSVLLIWKTYTPLPLRVRVPVNCADESKQ